MLILIAESKAMAGCDAPVSAELAATRRPIFDDRGHVIAASAAALDAAELARAVGVSHAMAVRIRQEMAGFAVPDIGARAIEAFTGVVFKAFDVGSLTDAERTDTAARVRIVSSLYGLLRPDDIVRQYRLDFTTKLAPDGLTMAAYWRDAVTAELLREIEAGGHTAVLNLLPADALRCIDTKAVEARVPIVTATFGSLQPGGSVRSPHATMLKKLRGTLLRSIIQSGADSPEAVALLPQSEQYPDTIVEIH